MFAPGIPSKQIVSNPPVSGPSEGWTLSLQKHVADKAGEHYDIRLSPPGGNLAYSWASKYWTEPGGKSEIFQQPDHTAEYATWSGTIPEGYGKGKVTLLWSVPADIIHSDPDKLSLVLHKGQTPQRLLFKRLEGSRWLLSNYTPTKASVIYSGLPSTKASYKSQTTKSLNPSSPEIWAPKLDGAHNLIVLRPDKMPDVFSYRDSKKSSQKIDHTFKTNLWKIRSPKELGNTVLRAEVYLPGRSGEAVAQRLNSSTLKSRQLSTNDPLRISAFDIVKFRGKSVEHLPYQRKLEMLEETARWLPELKLPQLARTPLEKRHLLRDIRGGTNPLTREGVVLYNPNLSVPLKAKIRQDWDAKIVGTFAAKRGSKYENRGVGGILALPEGSKTPIKIGTGLSDSLRTDLYQNPNQYLGAWLRVSGDRQHKSGKIQAPSLVELRPDKWPKNA
jgi:hypothetical protein